MALKPDEDIATHLATTLSLTAGQSVFASSERDPGSYVDHKSAFVVSTGGVAPQQINGQTTALRRAGVQVIARGDEEDYDGGLIFARSILNAIHYAPLTGYIDVRASQSEPIYLGKNETNHHRWSINAVAFYEE